MRILRGLYHFLLFLLVSWTVYNTCIFFCLILPPLHDREVEWYIFELGNFYLLGALDFHKLVAFISYLIHKLLNPNFLHEHWPFLIYAFFANGLAAFIWRCNQNPLGAAFLALAACLAGPYLGFIFINVLVLIFGIAGIFVFYGILSVLNDYRKKRWPWLSLPAWLEWRRPNTLPSLKSITHKMGRMFRKQSS